MLSAGQEFVAWQRAWMVNFNAANLATLVSSAAPFFVAPVLKIYYLDLSFVTLAINKIFGLPRRRNV